MLTWSIDRGGHNTHNGMLDYDGSWGSILPPHRVVMYRGTGLRYELDDDPDHDDVSARYYIFEVVGIARNGESGYDRIGDDGSFVLFNDKDLRNLIIYDWDDEHTGRWL